MTQSDKPHRDSEENMSEKPRIYKFHEHDVIGVDMEVVEKADYDQALLRIKELEADNKRYRETLESIAAASGYCKGEEPGEAITAREALKDTKE